MFQNGQQSGLGDEETISILHNLRQLCQDVSQQDFGQIIVLYLQSLKCKIYTYVLRSCQVYLLTSSIASKAQ